MNAFFFLCRQGGRIYSIFKNVSECVVVNMRNKKYRGRFDRCEEVDCYVTKDE